METYDLIIRNGFVVLPEEIKKTDIAIKNGVIAKIEANIVHPCFEERNAEGLYIFPGVIDIHVHLNDPGREEWEGFETGSNMLAAGGCTTYFDMPLNGIPSTVDKRALFQKAAIAQKKSVVDFAFWGGLVPDNQNELPRLAEAGAIGFKAFLSETGNKEFERVDDLTLLKGMKIIASLNKILALHSESAAITDWLTKEKAEKGSYSADDYLETRPIAAEVEAVDRAIAYAKLTGCALHFVHISSEAAVKKIEAAKQLGMDVTIETCPHYLLFTHDDLVEKGAIAKCAPPLRERKEQDKLLQCLIDGKFDLISSDHSPCPYSMKDPSIHHLFSAWGGINGGQFTLMSMIELALKFKLPLTKIAEWTSMAPAKRFGLEFKGKIAAGYDADFAIVSLQDNFTVTEKNILAKHKQSLYSGHTFPCMIKATLKNGKVIYENGEFFKPNSKGRWLKADTHQTGATKN